jgi:general secretion pathway protein L
MLSNFQAAAPDSITPTAIEFIAGELRLKGLDPSAAALAAISARLQAQGYSARLEAGSLVMKEERLP